MENRKYFKSIVFCKEFIHDHFRYKDIFQIYPVVDNRVRPDAHITQVPMFIEYWLNADTSIKTAPPVSFEDGVPTMDETQNNYLKDLLRQLSVYTSYHFFVNDYAANWSVPLERNSILPKLTKRSNYTANIYFRKYPKISSFTKIREKKYEDLPGEGYSHFNSKEEMTNLFDIFFGLEDFKKSAVTSSMALIAQGEMATWRMKSISFISYVSAIETMVELESKINNIRPERCECCGNLKYQVTKKFKDYLKLYLNDYSDEMNKALSKIYNMRSEITHKGQLMLGDAILDWNNYTKENEHYHQLEFLRLITKQSLRQWLLTQQ